MSLKVMASFLNVPLLWVDGCLAKCLNVKVLSTRRRKDYEISAKLWEPSFEALAATAVRDGGDISGGRRAGWCRPANCPPGGV